MMHLDDDLRLSILEKTGIYSNRLSVPEPKVLMTSKEVLEMPKEMTMGRRTTAYKYYGVSYMPHNLIFISETGSIAVAPASKGIAAPTAKAKEPLWTHGLNVKCRKHKEKEFGPETQAFGAEVFTIGRGDDVRAKILRHVDSRP